MANEREIYVKDIQGKFWAEVDYIEDYERILEHRGIERLEPCSFGGNR